MQNIRRDVAGLDLTNLDIFSRKLAQRLLSFQGFKTLNWKRKDIWKRWKNIEMCTASIM